MALFGKMFEKKICDICGNEIKLLGNRKLEDGNLCKECAGKLSPWFSERRQSTVAEIQEQLNYREANKEAVSAFNVTRTLGKGTKVLLDEDNRKFIVTSSNNFRNYNPDVLDFAAVTGCDINVEESKSEIRKRLPDGKYESYHPQQYNYDYNIYLTIFVNNPYFSQIRFRVNDSTIDIDNPYVQEDHSPRPQQTAAQPQAQRAPQPGNRGPQPGNRGPQPGARPMMNRPIPQFVPRPEENYEYQECYGMALDIKEALTQVRETIREEVAQANKPKVAVTCPYCGATTIPDANGCCEYCGGAVE